MSVVGRRTEAATHTAAGHHAEAAVAEGRHTEAVPRTVVAELGTLVAVVEVAEVVLRDKLDLDCGQERVRHSLLLGTKPCHRNCDDHQVNHLLMPQTGMVLDQPGSPRIHCDPQPQAVMSVLQ